MKNKYLLLITSLTFNILSIAQQVPNGGFETWTNSENPDGWFTFSSSGPLSSASKNTSDKFEGSASAKIQTSTFNSSSVYEILSLGTANWTFIDGYSYYPVYFPFRPDTLKFAYKYDSPGVDLAAAYIKLAKGKSILVETEIALGKTGQWSLASIVLTPLYSASDIPDSLLVQFQSSKTTNAFFGIDGSTLIVDNVHFGYANTPTFIQEQKRHSKPAIFPNPFTTHLSIVLSDNGLATLSLYDILGRQKLHHTITNSTTINTEQLDAGIYFYELITLEGELKTGKVVRQ